MLNPPHQVVGVENCGDAIVVQGKCDGTLVGDSYYRSHYAILSDLIFSKHIPSYLLVNISLNQMVVKCLMFVKLVACKLAAL